MHRGGVAGGLIVAVFGAVSLLAPILAPYGVDQSFGEIYGTPSLAHPSGLDDSTHVLSDYATARAEFGAYDAFEDGELKPEDVTKIATDLGVTEEDVISMNRRMAMGGDTSLNVPLRDDSEGTWQDFLVDSEPLQDERVAEAEESQMRHELLQEAMQALNERERHILTERRLKDEPITLEELSQQYDVSRERIRQIEVRAFEKLQKKMRELAAERGMVPAVN